MQGRSYTHPLPPRGRFDKSSLATPDRAEKGCEYQGGRIHEKLGALASHSFL
jgi:hypothetical protein